MFTENCALNPQAILPGFKGFCEVGTVSVA